MTTDIAFLLATAQRVLDEHDGLAPARAFFHAGLKGPDLGRLRHLDAVVRPRIGWYLAPSAPAAARIAVRVGGVLGCVSAAASYGIAVPDRLDGRTHISVPPDLTRMRDSARPDRHVHAGRDGTVRLHWERRLHPPRGWRVSPADAIAQMAACASLRWLTAAVDSARNATSAPSILAPSALPVLRAALPAHLRDAVDRSDPQAEASGETFIRLECQDRRIPVRSQSWLTSLYRSDHLVDEWLPVESDGVKFHSGQAVERDRERDAVLAYLGTPPLRFTQKLAVGDTAFVGDVIERTWRRGRPA